MTDDRKGEDAQSDESVAVDSAATAESSNKPETLAPDGGARAGSRSGEESIPTIAPPAGTFPPAEERPSGAPDLTSRYEIRGFIGEGGMGLVYKAYDRELDEEIAIKVLQRQFMLNESDIARFKREIKTARKIGHPNIIRIYDFGIADREAFISMELLPGGTLHEKEARGPIPFDEALRIAIEIAEGLGAAHQEKVIHRDIKPHNVLFDGNGRVKLVDFGIARFATNETVTQGVLGTPHYMSPEQADGAEADIRSDVYSLGVLLFELFTGRLPFESNSLTKILVMQVNEPPPRPRSIKPDLPFGLERIILKCLEKNPSQRYASGRKVAEALRDYRIAREAGLPDLPDAGQSASGRRRRRSLLVAGLLGMIALVGGAAFLARSQWLPPQPTPSGPVTTLADAEPTATEPHINHAEPTDTPTGIVKATAPPRTRVPRHTPQPVVTPMMGTRPTRPPPAQTPTPAGPMSKGLMIVVFPGAEHIEVVGVPELQTVNARSWLTGELAVDTYEFRVAGKVGTESREVKGRVKLKPGVYTRVHIDLNKKAVTTTGDSDHLGEWAPR